MGLLVIPHDKKVSGKSYFGVRARKWIRSVEVGSFCTTRVEKCEIASRELGVCPTKEKVKYVQREDPTNVDRDKFVGRLMIVCYLLILHHNSFTGYIKPYTSRR